MALDTSRVAVSAMVLASVVVEEWMASMAWEFWVDLGCILE